MGVVWQWNYAWWASQYPELAPLVSEQVATAYFARATAIHPNDATGPIDTLAIQQQALGLLVAHYASLYLPIDGQTPGRAVGRASSASKGSVSVALDYPGSPQFSWFYQTQYGAEYVEMIKPYIMGGTYIPDPYQQFVERPPFGFLGV